MTDLSQKTNAELAAHYAWVADNARSLCRDLAGSDDPETQRIAGHLRYAADHAQTKARQYSADKDLEDAAIAEIYDHQRRIDAARQQV